MRRFVYLLICLAVLLLPLQVDAGPRHKVFGNQVAAGGGASAWTDLTDTPGSITPNLPVCGNSGGTALEFCTDDDVPDAGDFGAATDLDANGALATDSVGDNEINYTEVTITDFDGTAWRVIYIDGSGDVQELALGADDTVLTSTGASSAPAFEAAAAGGDITDVWGCSTGDCQTLTAGGSDALDGTSASYMIPWVITTDCSAVIAEGRACWDSDDNVLYVGDSAAAQSWAASGDVTGVGDCASGACFDGSSDGGTTFDLYDGDSHKATFAIADLSGDVTYTFPAETGTIVTSASDDDVPEAGDFSASPALDGSGDIDVGYIQDYMIDWADVTLMDFDYQNPWQMFYSDGSGDVIELPFGTSGYVLTSNGASAAPSWTLTSVGDVTMVGECTSGDCFDGSTDGGNYLRFTDDGSYYTTLQAATGLGGNITINLPGASGTLITSGSDDDIPESGEGDFADAVDLEADGSLSNDVVAAAEMADADHGDVSWSGGVATVEHFAVTSESTVADDIGVRFGSAATDWFHEFDDSVDDQFLAHTTADGLVAQTDPMYLILADFDTADGANMTANQIIWGVGKGTQASNVQLLTVDEDGDVVAAATIKAGTWFDLGDANHAPGTVGRFGYDNTRTGIDDGALVWYDDDEIRTIIDLDASEGDPASGDDGHAVVYNYNGGNGYYDLQEAAMADEVFVTRSASSVLDNEYALGSSTGITLTNGGSPPDSTVTIGCSEADASTAGCAKFNDPGNIAISDEGDHSNVTIDLAAGDTYTNFGDAADDTLDELFDAIDTVIGGFMGDLTDDASPQLAANLDGQDYSITNIGTIDLDVIAADTDNGYVYFGDTDDLPVMRMDGTPAADDYYTGNVITSINCGENLAQWDLVYMDDTEDEWMKADANATGKFPAMGMVVAACTSGNEATVLMEGVVRNVGWAGTLTAEGQALYLSETAGGITTTQPSDGNDCVQHIGRTLNATTDVMYFRPDVTWWEIGS